MGTKRRPKASIERVSVSPFADLPWKYSYINTNHLFSLVKRVMKECDRGAMTREECATAFHELADKLVQRDVLTALPLEEVGDRVRNHLAKNRGK